MKKLTILIFTLFLCANAFADWARFSNTRDNSMIVYAKLPKTIHPDYKVKMWVLFDYNSKQKFANFEFKSIVNQIEFDCKGQLTRINYSAYYDKNMGEGVSTAINSNSTQ